MLNRLPTFLQTIPDLLTPKPVRMEVSLDDRLSDAIAQAVRNAEFKQKLIARPKPTLASLHIQIPASQQITIVESTPGQTFLVIPIATDREVEILQSGLNSQRSSRVIRSRILLKADRDSDYKQRLLTDPKAGLVAEYFQIAANVKVKGLENSLEHLHLVIPTIH